MASTQTLHVHTGCAIINAIVHGALVAVDHVLKQVLIM
jgi:hypothetical protein